MKNSIEYNGNVRITINKRSFKYTNAGKLQLFKVIANILSGNSNYKSDTLPSYISCIQRDRITQAPVSILSPVMISNRTVEEDATSNKVTLRLAAIFTYTDKRTDPSFDANYDIYLELHDNTSTKTTLAEVRIENKDLINQIEKGRSALIEWDLVFSNGGSN